MKKIIDTNASNSNFDAVLCELEENGTYLLIHNEEYPSESLIEKNKEILFDKSTLQENQEHILNSIEASFTNYQKSQEINEKILALHNILGAIELQLPFPQKNILIENTLKQDYQTILKSLNNTEEIYKHEKIELLKSMKTLLEIYHHLDKLPDEFLVLKLNETTDIPYLNLKEGTYMILNPMFNNDNLIFPFSSQSTIYEFYSGKAMKGIYLPKDKLKNKYLVVHKNRKQKIYQLEEEDFKKIAMSNIKEYAIVEIKK